MKKINLLLDFSNICKEACAEMASDIIAREVKNEHIKNDKQNIFVYLSDKEYKCEITSNELKLQDLKLNCMLPADSKYKENLEKNPENYLLSLIEEKYPHAHEIPDYPLLLKSNSSEISGNNSEKYSVTTLMSDWILGSYYTTIIMPMIVSESVIRKIENDAYTDEEVTLLYSALSERYEQVFEMCD